MVFFFLFAFVIVNCGVLKSHLERRLNDLI